MFPEKVSQVNNLFLGISALQSPNRTILPYLYISSPRVWLPLLDISAVSLWFSAGRTPNTFKLFVYPRWFQKINNLEPSLIV